MNSVRLKIKFDKGNFDPEASAFKIFCWYVISLLIFRSGIVPFSSILVRVLKLFGATIGRDVRIKPGIFIRYPWKLTIGDFSWLGECYIDNLDYVIVGKNACISQKSMLITGNHNYSDPLFSLFTKPIILQDGVWIGAGSIVGPGTVASSHSVLCMGSVATKNLDRYTIYSGNPALKVKERKMG